MPQSGGKLKPDLERSVFTAGEQMDFRWVVGGLSFSWSIVGVKLHDKLNLGKTLLHYVTGCWTFMVPVFPSVQCPHSARSCVKTSENLPVYDDTLRRHILIRYRSLFLIKKERMCMFCDRCWHHVKRKLMKETEMQLRWSSLFKPPELDECTTRTEIKYYCHT